MSGKKKAKPKMMSAKVGVDNWKDIMRLSMELRLNGEDYSFNDVVTRLLEDAGEKTIFSQTD